MTGEPPVEVRMDVQVDTRAPLVPGGGGKPPVVSSGAVEIRQVAGMTLAARGSSNHWVIMDTAKAMGGAEAGASPMELVLFALGGCTGMDIISILKKMRVAYDEFRITMDFTRTSEHPKVYSDITLHFHFTGTDLPLAKLEKAVALSRDRYCGVQAMLRGSVNITTEIHVHEV